MPLLINETIINESYIYIMLYKINIYIQIIYIIYNNNNNSI
jgi:hypothetical protein